MNGIMSEALSTFWAGEQAKFPVLAKQAIELAPAQVEKTFPFSFNACYYSDKQSALFAFDKAHRVLMRLVIKTLASEDLHFIDVVSAKLHLNSEGGSDSVTLNMRAMRLNSVY